MVNNWRFGWLIALMAVAALSGCVQPGPAQTVYKFVCADGSVASAATGCASAESSDCNEWCTANKGLFCNEAPSTGEVTKETVLSEMQEANYCQEKSDCALADTKCPLGCYNLVNKAKLEAINALVKEFKQPACYQTCATLMDSNCVEGKCRPVAYGEG